LPFELFLLLIALILALGADFLATLVIAVLDGFVIEVFIPANITIF